MKSRGELSGGYTILDAIHVYEERGYDGHFAPREGGAMECFACHQVSPPGEVRLDSLRRIEGASDPADMSLVAALKCPRCGSHGIATFKYGPGATAEEGEAMRLIDDVRSCMASGFAGGECVPSYLAGPDLPPRRGLDYNDEIRGPGM